MANLAEGLTPIIIYILDWETGGLDCNKCGVTQISVHALRLNDFEPLGKFMRYILPYNRHTDTGNVKPKKTLKSKFDDGVSAQLMEYSDEALAVQGITMEALYQKGIPLEDMVKELLEWMDTITPPAATTRGNSSQPILLGQNIIFDEGFLSQVMEYTKTTNEFKKRMRGKEDFYGHWHPIMLDTITLAQCACCHEPVSSYKLELICEKLGIDLVDAHDADADVEATESVFTVLANRMRSEGGNYSGADLPDKQADKTRRHFKI